MGSLRLPAAAHPHAMGGWDVNLKSTYRLCRDEGLSMRPKLHWRKRAWRYRWGDRWPERRRGVEFVSDRPFQILTVVDYQTREALTSTRRANFHSCDAPENSPAGVLPDHAHPQRARLHPCVL